MPVQHTYVSAVSDGENTTLVRPSDWNADHLSVACLIFKSSGLYVFSNIGSAVQDLRQGTANVRTRVDLATCTQCRMTGSVLVAGNSTAYIGVQYGTTLSSWSWMTSGNGPAANISAVGMADTGWLDLVSGAKANNLYLRMVNGGGDSVADPQISDFCLYVR